MKIHRKIKSARVNRQGQRDRRAISARALSGPSPVLSSSCPRCILSWRISRFEPRSSCRNARFDEETREAFSSEAWPWWLRTRCERLQDVAERAVTLPEKWLSRIDRHQSGLNGKIEE